MNKDFRVTRKVICQWFSLVTQSWKSLANRLTCDPKIIIHDDSGIILYILVVQVRHYVQPYFVMINTGVGRNGCILSSVSSSGLFYFRKLTVIS